MQVASTSVITAEMNVTPMIDVLLVLIIVAIVLLALEGQFLVNVPAARQPAVGGGQHAIVLELDAVGGYSINGHRVPEVGLEARLRALFAKRPDEVLFMHVSGDREYQDVIHAIDVAHAAGARLIGYMP